ncbi:MAG TPA: histidine kinase [Sphingomicrobium sp.]|nr:histidine kinase [Sphingomicrobium sp.]
MGKGLHHSSGRVIALGRLIQAMLFLLALRLDPSQPTFAPQSTYAILAIYLFLAAAIAAATWNNWWLDARMAGPAHAIDILMFSMLVLLTAGYTSPFFTFFMFILLSAAIRWGWRATALSATLLTLLFLAAGFLVIRSGAAFELQRFAVRTGHLVILSLLLIWFGASQRWIRVGRKDEELFPAPSLDESPVETGLRATMAGLRATTGVFVSRKPGQGHASGLTIEDGSVSEALVLTSTIARAIDATPFLYDFGHRRALKRDADRNLVPFDPDELVSPQASRGLRLGNGLAIPVRSDWAEGVLFLEKVPGLSTDHIDVAAQLSAEIATHIQRHALLKAAEESAEARSRLALARDLHDSVVQFVAGASFRLEAMKRSHGSGRAIEAELDELKQLMMQEQRELRSFITSLRSGPLAAFNDLAKDLRALADRLSRQWDVTCSFSAEPAELMIPTRLRLDAHQLMREAVANAVRHASAQTITVELAALADALKLEFINDGAEFPRRHGQVEMPATLKERVEQAAGAIDMARGMGVTRLSISLPLSEAAR